MVIGGYIAPLINMLADLLSSCIYFQDQNTMKTLRDTGLKITAVQVLGHVFSARTRKMRRTLRVCFSQYSNGKQITLSSKIPVNLRGKIHAYYVFLLGHARC